MRFLYRVKAIGMGRNDEQHKLDFIVSSVYDIDKNKSLVMSRVTSDLQRNWGNKYEILSVTKLTGG